jgi:hypothetical protein
MGYLIGYFPIDKPHSIFGLFGGTTYGRDKWEGALRVKKCLGFSIKK